VEKPDPGRKPDLRKSQKSDQAATRPVVVLCAVLTTGGGLVLKYYNDPAPFLDSTTTFLSIVAMYLMVKTYSEQWYLWITVNVSTIIMWGMAFIREGDASHLIIASMWCVYLLNSVHGLIIWKRAAKSSSLTN